MPRQPFNVRWAQGVETQDSSTVFQTPDNTRQTTGWEGGLDKDAPPAGQENWWHNRVDSGLQGVERNGVMNYHPQAIYGIGAPTYASDGNYYESLVSANTGNDPVSTSGFWRFVGSSFFAGSDPGDLKFVAHNDVPSTGWLKCNGAAVLRASYPRLFTKIGTTWNTGGETSTQFRLPDFRGEFLRGFDDGKGVDASRQFGSYQAPTFIRTAASDYSGGDTTGARSAIGTGFSGADSIESPPPSPRNPDGSVMNPPLFDNVVIGDLNSVSLPSGSRWVSSRPRNKTVNYWIKY